MSKILNTYNRKKISFSKGKGSFLYTTNGKKYLDFVQGIAVNCLGHANDYLIRSINKQSKKLWHVSNAFEIPEEAYAGWNQESAGKEQESNWNQILKNYQEECPEEFLVFDRLVKGELPSEFDSVIEKLLKSHKAFKDHPLISL